MKNEQKKNYVQPEMTVLDFTYQATPLLNGSCGEYGNKCEEVTTEAAVEFN